MKSVESGLLGGKVPYIRAGSGAREAIVFFGVNALFKRLDQVSDPARYARQVAKLIPGYRFTILGYAGGGFDEIVADMAAVIPSAADLLVGISFGGFVAMRFAAEHPEKVRRLVLLVSAHRFSPNGSRMIQRQEAALEREDWSALIRENALLFRRPWFNWLVRLKLWKDGERLGDGARDASAILRDYRALFGPEFARNASYAGRIACPTLIIGGTADQFFDRAAFEETVAWIPGSRIHLLEGETHMLPIERSPEAARLITAEEMAGPDRR